MKTFAKLFAVLAFLAVGFTSCGGDEVDDLVISKESVTLNANQSETIAIESGNGSYKAVSTNDAVATATIKDDVITVTAHADGNAVITISDKEDKSVLINVTVGTPAQEISYTVTKVTVEAGKTYGYKQGETTGTFYVNSATKGSVEVKIGGATVVLLSDAGNSYMSIQFAGMNFATASADASKVLFCLLSESTTIASGTEAASDAIKTGATETKFTASAIEE